MQNPSLRDRGRGKRWLVLISAILLLVLSAILYLQFHQRSLLGNTLRLEEDNIYWGFSQLEIESHRLREALQKRANGAAAISDSELQMRLDIFYSRYSVLKDGEGFQLIVAYLGNEDALRETESFLQAFAPYFADGGASNLTAESVQRMLEALEALRRPLYDLSLAANMMASTRAEYTATEVKRQISFSAGLIVILGVLVLLFSCILTRQIRQLEATRTRLSALADQLAQSNDKLKERASAMSKALEQADRSNAELSSYMQAMDQHAQVSIVELDGHIAQVNDKFCDISGYRREELRGRDYRVLNSGMHPDFYFAELWHVIGQGEVWRGEICNRAKEGTLYWVDTTIVPLKDAQGKTMRYISMGIDITEQKEGEQRIGYLASHDTLTGLPNRNLLLDRLRQALARDRRERCQTGVIFIDLDHFKMVNDRLGYEAGDRVLKEVARRLSEAVREQDTVARQGGDEFIVLLPGLHGLQDASALAHKLIEKLGEPYQLNAEECLITASAGIALSPDDGNDEVVLLKHSDVAMHHAKAGGRNAFRFFCREMNFSAALPGREEEELASEAGAAALPRTGTQ